MVTVGLDDELCVVIWQAELGTRCPLGYPIMETEYTEKPIEVIDGEVDTVVRVRIIQQTPEKLRGKVVEHLHPESNEWDKAKEILNVEYDFETEEIEQEGRRRLMIRSSKDYHNQWVEHKKETLGKVPDSL